MGDTRGPEDLLDRGVSNLEPGDTRVINVNVAGPSALLIAKAFKINDRLVQAVTRPDRLTNKDASDVLRIMTVTDARTVARSLTALRGDPRVGAVVSEGEELLYRLFGGASAPGVKMAVEALAGDVPEERIRALAPAFVRLLRS